MSLRDPIADDIIAEYVARQSDETTRDVSATTLSGRQILIVDKVVHTASNFIISNADKTPRCRSEMTLTGRPSPSSEVEKAYLRFVPTQDLRTPAYIPERKTIFLTLDEKFQSPVLHTIALKNLYCWIGAWPNGHIYGDIHGHN